MNNKTPPITCLCDSRKLFQQCCGPFITNKKTPKTVKQLMRSRFTAYKLGGYGQYLLATWLPESAAGLTVELLSETSHDWVKLDVLASEQNGDQGMVEFNAYYNDENGVLTVLHERSSFQRLSGRWFYDKGEVATLEA